MFAGSKFDAQGVWAVALLIVFTAGLAVGDKPTSIAFPATAPRALTLDRLPLYFVENRGQLDERVSYYVVGRDKTVFFTSAGVRFALAGAPLRHDRATADSPASRWTVALDFVDARPTEPTGLNPSHATMSHFRGAPEHWVTGLRLYAGVRYENPWPGIDVVYDGTQSALKYTFFVAPGADPAQIRVAYRGADSVALTEVGGLSITTKVGGFDDGAPIAWQTVDGRRIDVPVRFHLERQGEAHVASFKLGDYDPQLPLVIDPAIFLFSGFLGGSANEIGFATAVDASGMYVTGETTSADFPTTIGPDLTFNAGTDAFVAKLSTDGSALVYVGYIGGSGNDSAYGIAVDAAGAAYVTGSTTSADFPTAIGPDATLGGTTDAFVAKINSAGTALDYAGYIGGALNDTGRGIAVDGNGEAYVVGVTNSTDFIPAGLSVGPDLTANGGNDGFVAKVNATGSALAYAGYIGGSAADEARGIAVDSSGAAYVAGFTASTEATFPDTVGPDLTYNGGSLDAFAGKVNAAGTAFDYMGFIGGSGFEQALGVAVDSTGAAYVAGTTGSTEASFPVIGGPDITFNGAAFDQDAFVAKINPGGSGLAYAGYIGGSNSETAYAIAVDAGGAAYVTGTTLSAETTVPVPFPVASGPDLTFNGIGNDGVGDAFVAKVLAGGAALQFAGYIGGAAGEVGHSIAVDATGAAYITGVTSSTENDNFPLLVGPDATFNGAVRDAFVAKVLDADNADLAVTIASTSPVPLNRSTVATVYVTNNGPLPATRVGAALALTGGSFTFDSISSSQGSCTGTTSASCALGSLASGATASVTVALTPTATGVITLNANSGGAESDLNLGNNAAVATINAVNTICSNNRDVGRGRAADACSASVGGAKGGGGALDFIALALLVTFACVRGYRRQVR